MAHDWIYSVLEDLRCYALLNGLPATAAKAEEALRVAREEVEVGNALWTALEDLPPDGPQG